MATILIIDDLAVNREYLVTLLGYGGHRLVQAGDGAEGLDAVRTERPDLVIADILMPTMDGFEFVRRLRADPEIAATPVIFFTAHYLAREAQSLARECGVEHVLTKPAEPEEVLRIVAAALTAAAPSEAAPSPPVEVFDREHTRLLTDTLSHTVDQLQSTNARLHALVELGLQLGSERDPARLLQTYLSTARTILGASYAMAGVLSADGTHPRHFLTSGIEPALAKELGALEPHRGAFGAILGGQRLRLQHPSPALEDINQSSGLPACQAFLGSPISSPTRIYGWASFFDKLGMPGFTLEDERLAGVLAAQVGRIYENGSLYVDLLEHSARLESEIQERERIETQLRRSEGLFRSAFEDTSVAMVITDLDNRFLRANAAFAALFGYGADEVLQLTMADITHPDSLEPSYEGRRKLLAGESHFFLTEKRYRRKDGATLWGATNVSLVRDDGGRPMLYVGMVEDLTARKQAEAALRASEGRLEHVVASSPAVLFSLSARDSVLWPTWHSPNIKGLLGYLPEEALKASWWYERVHPEDLEEAVATIEHELFTQDRVSVDYRFRHQNGEYRWLRCEIRLLRDAEGCPEEAVGSWSDITGRVQTKQALAERARLASMSAEIGQWLTQARDLRETLHNCVESVVQHLDAAFARIWTVDDAGETLELQASAGRYTHLDGVHSRIPVGRHKIGKIARERRPHLTNCVTEDPDIRDQAWARREGLVSFAGYPLVVENRLIGVMALFSGHTLPEATLEWLGRVAGDVAIGIERRRAEDALEKANVLLEEALSELRRAQSKIVEQERLRALGELASGVAHDFNNALSPILGFTDLLLRHPPYLADREKLVSYLEIIRTAAQDGASVVHRLREFYRPRDETDVLVAVDLNAIVEQSVELSRPRWKDQAQSRGATVEMVTDLGEVPAAAGDAAHLREAVMNLIFNAVDAMPQGGRITLRTFPGEEGGAVLELTDTGTGMTEEVRQRCLQPFFSTKGDQGTGLGLSMVYGIVQRHDGSLAIRSSPGRGTTVAITLKAYTGETQTAADTTQLPPPALRILVVDDEERVGRTTAAMLEAEGHTVVTTDNGNTALAYLQTSTFDLVVTDRAMPGMSGDQLAAGIRKLDPKMQVLMLTGFGELMRGVEELPAGVDLVVSKPVTMAGIHAAIRELTSRRQK